MAPSVIMTVSPFASPSSFPHLVVDVLFARRCPPPVNILQSQSALTLSSPTHYILFAATVPLGIVTPSIEIPPTITIINSKDTQKNQLYDP